jgi:hypothetical protein
MGAEWRTEMANKEAPAQDQSTANETATQDTTQAADTVQAAVDAVSPRVRRIAWTGRLTSHPTAPSVRKAQGYTRKLRADSFTVTEPGSDEPRVIVPDEGKARAEYNLLARLADDMDARILD